MSLTKILSIYNPIDRRTAAAGINEYGYTIRIVPETTPILQLSDHVDVSDEFRSTMNDWLLQTFGRDTDVPHGDVHINHSTRELVMSKKTYDELRSNPAAAQLPAVAGWSVFA